MSEEKDNSFKLRLLSAFLFVGLVVFTYLFTAQENKSSNSLPQFIASINYQSEISSEKKVLNEISGVLRVEIQSYMREFRKLEKLFAELGGFKQPIELSLVGGDRPIYEISENSIRMNIKTFFLRGQAEKALIKSFLYQSSESPYPSLFLSEVMSELILLKFFGYSEVEVGASRSYVLSQKVKWPEGISSLKGLCSRASKPNEVWSLCESMAKDDKSAESRAWSLLSLKPLAVRFLSELFELYSWTSQIELLLLILENIGKLDIDFGSFEIPGDQVFSLHDSKVPVISIFEAVLSQENIKAKFPALESRLELVSQKLNIVDSHVDFVFQLQQDSALIPKIDKILGSFSKYIQKESQIMIVNGGEFLMVSPYFDRVKINGNRPLKIKSRIDLVDACTWPNLKKLKNSVAQSEKMIWTRACSTSQSYDLMGFLSKKPLYNFVGRNPKLELIAFDSDHLKSFKVGKRSQIGFVLTENKLSQQEIDLGVTNLRWDPEIKAHRAKDQSKTILWSRNHIKELYIKLVE